MSISYEMEIEKRLWAVEAEMLSYAESLEALAVDLQHRLKNRGVINELGEVQSVGREIDRLCAVRGELVRARDLARKVNPAPSGRVAFLLDADGVNRPHPWHSSDGPYRRPGCEEVVDDRQFQTVYKSVGLIPYNMVCSACFPTEAALREYVDERKE